MYQNKQQEEEVQDVININKKRFEPYGYLVDQTFPTTRLFQSPCLLIFEEFCNQMVYSNPLLLGTQEYLWPPSEDYRYVNILVKSRNNECY